MATTVADAGPAKLVRGIRRWDLVAVAINGTIGASIFGLPSRLFELSGVYSLLAFLVCAAVITLIVLCFAEVGSRFTQSGGPYLYARETFGSAVGFEVGWLLWLARLTAFATNCNLLITYLALFMPQFGAGGGRIAVIALIVSVLTTINIIGVRETAIVTDIFTVGKLIPLLLFIGVGVFYIDPEALQATSFPATDAFWMSVLLLIYSFSGFEYATIPGAEVQDPKRNIPFAILVTVVVVTAVYLLIQLVCIGTFPGLAASPRPLADAASHMVGAGGAVLIGVGAIISITGGINGMVLASSRLLFAMSEQRHLPKFLSRTNARFRTPHFAILFSAVTMLVLTVATTFIYALTISTLIRLLTYAATCAALPVLRRRETEHPAHFHVRGGPVIAVIALLLITWLLSHSTLREVKHVAIAAAIGLPVLVLSRIGQSRKEGLP